MREIQWPELKPANEKIKKMILDFVKRVTDINIPQDKIRIFLTTIMQLIINPGREDELRQKLDDQLKKWMLSKKKIK